MICKCCGRETESSKCWYCRHQNITLLDDSGLQKEIERGQKKKQQILDSIKDISINKFIYKWNDDQNTIEPAGTERDVICNGTSCYENTVWSSSEFAQVPAVENGAKSITIFYTLDGVSKSVTTEINTIATEDFWKIGVKITDDLRMVVYLGTVSNNSSSEAFDIDLIT